MNKLLKLIKGGINDEALGYLFIKGKHLRYDLQKHSVLGAFLAVLYFVYNYEVGLGRWLGFTAAITTSFVIALLIELVQTQMKNRTFDMLDVYVTVFFTSLCSLAYALISV